MEKITSPIVSLLAADNAFTSKQMQAVSSQLNPAHHSNMESILFVYEYACILKMNEEEISLIAGKTFIIPPLVKHQIKAKTDFKGIYFMPKNIKFEFFN